jgi:Pyruvate/2-oxoacid:ferredoxin oxidoreductase gamma subunit
MLGPYRPVNPGSLDVLKKIVASSVPKKYEELNIKALEAGYEYYRTHKPGQHPSSSN